VCGGCRAGGRARDIGDERAVRFLGIGTIFEIARGCVVPLHALARDPCQARMCRYRGVGLIDIGVDERIAGEAE